MQNEKYSLVRNLAFYPRIHEISLSSAVKTAFYFETLKFKLQHELFVITYLKESDGIEKSNINSRKLLQEK